MHPFSLNEYELKVVTGGVTEGGCVITPIQGENGDSSYFKG